MRDSTTPILHSQRNKDLRWMEKGNLLTPNVQGKSVTIRSNNKEKA